MKSLQRAQSIRFCTTQLVLTLLLLTSGMAFGQHGIGTNQPNPNAALHVDGVAQGVLLPKTTLASSTQFLGGGTAAAVDNGMVVYNTSSSTINGLSGEGYYVWQGGASGEWKRITVSDAFSLIDSDGDTQVQVEESADDDIIRFDTAGMEVLSLNQYASNFAVNVNVGTVSGSSATIIPNFEAFAEANVTLLNAVYSFGPTTAALLFDQSPGAGTSVHVTRDTTTDDWGISYAFNNKYKITSLRVQTQTDATYDLRIGGGVFQIYDNGTMVYQSPVVTVPDAPSSFSPAILPNVTGDEVRYVVLAGGTTQNGDTFLNGAEIEIVGQQQLTVGPNNLFVSGSTALNGALMDASGDAGTAGQVLSSTSTGTNWVNPNVLSVAGLIDSDGDTQVKVEEGLGDDDDTIRFDTAGVERAVIDNNGNVGIGGASGSEKLKVTGDFYNTGGAKLVVQGGVNGGSNRGIFMWTNNNTSWGINLASSGAGKSLSGGNATVGVGFTNTSLRFRVFGDSGNGVIFENSNEELLASIRGSDGLSYFAGDMGIGVTPTAKLDVNGRARIRTLPAGVATDQVVTADANGNLRKRTFAAIGSDDQNITGSGLSGTTLTIGIEGGSNETVDLISLRDGDAWGVTGEDLSSTISRTGNVGIGGASGSEKLKVTGDFYNTGGAKLVVQGGVDGGSNRGIFMWTNTNTDWGINLASSGAGKSLSGGNATAGTGFTNTSLRFRVFEGSDNGVIFENSNEELLASIRGSDGLSYFAGDMGIGVTPTAKLDVNGQARIRTLPAGVATDQVITANADGDLRKRDITSVVQEPWQIKGTTDPATSNTDNIIQNGNVTIGNTTTRKSLTFTGALYGGKIRETATTTGITWTDDDFCVVVTAHTPIALPPATPAQVGRIVSIRNNSTTARQFIDYATNIDKVPENFPDIRPGVGVLFMSTGTAWHVLSGR